MTDQWGLPRIDITRSGVTPLGVSADAAAGVYPFQRVKPMARVYNSANISIPDSAWTSLAFDSERFDTDNLHGSTNTSRLSPQTGATYLVGGCVRFAASAAGNTRGARIIVNGATVISQSMVSATLNAANDEVVSVATLYAFSKGDYVELQAFQNSGGALNAVASANSSPEFWCVVASF